MSNSNGLYEFTAQITDADTGVVTIPDYGCELSCSWDRGAFSVDYVFIRNKANRLINLSHSTDPLTKRIVACVIEQAENDERLIAETMDDYEEAA